MKSLQVPLYIINPQIQAVSRTTLVLPDKKIYQGGEKLNLNELHYNLLKGGTPQENVFRARLFVGELNRKISILGGLDNLFVVGEIPRYVDVLNDLTKLADGNVNYSENVLSNKNAEVVSYLIEAVENSEQSDTYNKQIKGSLDAVTNGIADRIVSILI